MRPARPWMKLGVLLLLSALIGVLTGLAAFALFYLVQMFNNIFLVDLGSLELPKPAGEVELVKIGHEMGILPLFIIPAIGGLIVGLIAYSVAPETAGGGTGPMIESFHKLGGFVRARVPFVKTIISAITIGSGGSAGTEGPISQIGGGIGSTIANLFRLSDEDRRILLVSGMSGGIGAVFLAPLGGAFFGVEILYKRDYEVEALLPAIVSSVISYCVLEWILCRVAGVPFGQIRLFKISPSLDITSPIEFAIYLLLGVVAGLIGFVYIFSYDYSKKAFRTLRIPDYFKPAIGGLIVGLMGLYVHQVYGIGYGFCQMVLKNCARFTIALLFLLAFAKIFATTLTVGSGGSGGLFAPSLVIGSFIGGAIGLIFHYLMPNVVIHPEAYALAGMAAFLSGVSKTPLTAIALALETTGCYKLLPAIVVSSVVADLITGDYTLYPKQVPTRFDSPAHRETVLTSLLEKVKVKDIMVPVERVVTVTPDQTALDVLRLIERTGYMSYPVVENDKVVGIVTIRDVKRISEDERARTKVKNIMVKSFVVAHPDEDLKSALTKMVSYGVERLVVVSRDNKSRLLGLITKGDIIRAYERMRTI